VLREEPEVLVVGTGERLDRGMKRLRLAMLLNASHRLNGNSPDLLIRKKGRREKGKA
jgi:hypothetical protein